MDIKRRISEARNLTPVEQELGSTVLKLGEDLRAYSIKELARACAVSVASIHRFCKKLGLEGFKELKVEVARASARSTIGEVDINFPFGAHSTGAAIAPSIEDVYRTTLADTRNLLEPAQLDRAAELIVEASVVDLYTQSHNYYPAETFNDRLMSIGLSTTCPRDIEQQVRRALASDEHHAAIVISYSGLAPNIIKYLPLLRQRNTPVICIGSPQAARRNPGLAAYLTVSDRESMSRRITQFSSHIAVQYVLDVLYGCVFARTYERSMRFTRQALPFTTPHPMRADSQDLFSWR